MNQKERNEFRSTTFSPARALSPRISQGDLGNLDMPRNRAPHWHPSARRLPIARFRREGLPIRRILFATSHPYLDDTNGAAVASRAMMESLRRSGFAVEALSGIGPDATEHANPAAWLTARGIAF